MKSSLANARLVFLIIGFLGITSCGSDEAANSVSIEFVSADPSSLSLQGTGGAGKSETSTVQFRVKDPQGVILEGQIVNMELSTQVGGISLNPATGFTDVNGLINTVVQSGSVATPVRIIASIPGTDISTQSDLLAIGSGVPDQNSASISSERNNPESFGIDGVAVTFTMRLADIFNNPVPAGTSVSFTTEGGSIDSNCLTDDEGACSVIWRSQDPRPPAIGGDGAGVTTIMATALGQESFTDNNGNGIFDQGDSFDDIGEAFRDDNGNDSYDVGEFFVDLNANNIFDGPDGLYNGSACKADFNLCSSQKNIHIRSSKRIVMSTSFGIITLSNSNINVSGGAQTIRATVEDANNNSMPGGTTISVSVTNGRIQNEDVIPTTISELSLSPTSFDIIVGTDGTSSSDGNLNIKLTSPNGFETIRSVAVTD